MILDLDKKDFRIFDNGVEQRVEDFEMGGAPISMAIVVETSSRIQALLPAIRRTGILFTQTVLGEGGDATVIGYNDEVDKLLDFTSDEDAIEGAIKNLQQGTSGAKLYDALAEAVAVLRNRPASRRRVIVTLAEAVDTGSEDKLGQVLRDAQLANITIYSVGLSSTAAQVRGPRKTGQRSGGNAARDLRLAAGARHDADARHATRRAPATSICSRSPCGRCSTLPRPFTTIRSSWPPSPRAGSTNRPCATNRSSRRSTRSAASSTRSTRSPTGRAESARPAITKSKWK